MIFSFVKIYEHYVHTTVLVCKIHADQIGIFLVDWEEGPIGPQVRIS